LVEKGVRRVTRFRTWAVVPIVAVLVVVAVVAGRVVAGRVA
jgi:hypothetical protein